MQNKCDCYKTIQRLRYTTFYTQSYYETVGICNGTKERDECSCGGDRTKCDFYPEVREKARNEQKNNRTKNSDDCLIITYDYCHSDVPTLCIAREERDKVRVLNTIQGDQAFGMYCYLTGNAELKEKEIETNADKIRSMSDEELAEFLISEWFTKDMCKKCEDEHDKCGVLKFCDSKILEWLKRESI